MPVDPATLRGYEPPPAPPGPPRRTWFIALLIGLGGSLFFGVFFALAMGSPSLIRAYYIALVIACGALTLERLYSGLQEDGILGAVHRMRNPFGNLMLGDDIEHTNRYTIAAAFALFIGGVLAGVLTIL